VTTLVIASISIMVYLFKEHIVRIFTNLEDVQEMVLNVIWLISFNTFPDGFKAMLRGIVRALGIQEKCVYINIAGFGLVNVSLQWFFAFHLNFGLLGMWAGKLCMEIFIFSSFWILIAL